MTYEAPGLARRFGAAVKQNHIIYNKIIRLYGEFSLIYIWNSSYFLLTHSQRMVR
jgi:hypothetical protein